MTNSKRLLLLKSLALFLPLGAYCIAMLLRNDTWSNLLSPLNAYLAAGILLFGYLRTNRAVKVSSTLLLYSLGCLVWALSDTLWAIVSFSGGNPENMPVLWVAYVLTNLVFLSALVVFARYQFQKWDLIQTALDISINGFLALMIFWILFFRKDVTLLVSFTKTDFTSVLSVATDILIDVSIYSWLLSIRKGSIPTFLRIISGGLLLYTYADIAYYYMSFNGIELPVDLTSFVYIAAMSVIAFGALWKTYKNSTVLELTALLNTGGNRRWMYLLLYPSVIMSFVFLGFVPIQLTPMDYTMLFVPILIYWTFCKYIQLSLDKEALLTRDKELLEQRVAEQLMELNFLANQDLLTALFNRRYFMECLEETLKNRRQSETLTLLLLDMDRFKTINDTYGHDVGDRILLDFSQRLLSWNSYGATLARLGGDEFAVMLVGKFSTQDIERYCNDILAFCTTPFAVGTNTLTLTLSIGVATAPENLCDGKTLLQNADIAMYQAKARGYNKFQVFTPMMSESLRKSTEIELLLKKTDPNTSFELFYQPQFSLPDKRLIGAEALLRWNTTEHGYVPPGIFIPIAEQSDYIHRLGHWVMGETIRQTIDWNNTYHLDLKVGFNISPKQLLDDNFAGVLSTTVAKSSLNTAWLDAELTESLMIQQGDNTDRIFTLFQDLGISVSIDDFGSGYSALGYLNKYPFDRIKIDKSLIDNMTARGLAGANVVRAAIDMAHASGIKTIAEGVETQEQLDILCGLGCDQVQGYLLGRPVPAEVFEQRFIQASLQLAENY